VKQVVELLSDTTWIFTFSEPGLVSEFQSIYLITEGFVLSEGLHEDLLKESIVYRRLQSFSRDWSGKNEIQQRTRQLLE
jgi:hypothetical protein